MRSRFLALRVRPANRNITRAPDGSLPECWLPAEWPTGAPEPTDYRLATLPPTIPLRDLVRLAKIAGASNTTTANSKTDSAWTTSKADPGPATATPATNPSPPQHDYTPNKVLLGAFVVVESH